MYVPAAQNWSKYEGSCLHLLPHPEVADSFESIPVALGVGRLEAHYFKNLAFLLIVIFRIEKVIFLGCLILQSKYKKTFYRHFNRKVMSKIKKAITILFCIIWQSILYNGSPRKI